MYTEEDISRQVDSFLSARKAYYEEKGSDGMTTQQSDVKTILSMGLLHTVPAQPRTILFDEDGNILPVIAYGVYEDPQRLKPAWWPVVRDGNIAGPVVSAWLEEDFWARAFGPMVFTETVPRDRLLVLHRVRLQTLPDVSGAFSDLIHLVESFGLKVIDPLKQTH